MVLMSNNIDAVEAPRPRQWTIPDVPIRSEQVRCVLVRRTGRDWTRADIVPGRTRHTVAMPSDPESIDDPLRDFCEKLCQLHSEAGGPSVVALAKNPSIPLGRSQIYAVLRGKIKKLPDWEFVRSFVEKCEHYSRMHSRTLSLSTDLAAWRREYGYVTESQRRAKYLSYERSSASASGTDHARHDTSVSNDEVVLTLSSAQTALKSHKDGSIRHSHGGASRRLLGLVSELDRSRWRL
jgi:hypothetical protein